MLITVTAAVTLTFAVPAALADDDGGGTLSLVFAVQPTTTQVQTAMTPAVVVDVENSQGYLVTNFNGPVTLSYAVNNVGAPLPANNVVDAVNGVATFSALTFSAVGFGFELQASISRADDSPSRPFDIVTQSVQCQPGQSCQTGTVSSDGTSGFAVASAASTSDVLAATGGGFPALSCTSTFLGGGVLTFTVANRSKTITLMLAKAEVQQNMPPGSSHFTICWGSANPFTTANGSTSLPNPKNGNEFEGLVARCPLPPGSLPSSPCIASQHKTGAGVEVATISVPPGDGHITW